MRYKFNDWSESPSDLDKWQDELDILASKKFGRDQDSDCPVKVYLVDRTKYDSVHWWLVPYHHKAKTEKQLEEIEDALLTNLDTAMKALQVFRDIEKHKARRKSK